MLLTLLTYETRLLSFWKLRESYQFFILFAPHAATFSSATLMHIFFRGISRIVSCPIGILPKKHLLRAPATDPPIHYNKITSKKTARKHKKNGSRHKIRLPQSMLCHRCPLQHPKSPKTKGSFYKLLCVDLWFFRRVDFCFLRKEYSELYDWVKGEKIPIKNIEHTKGSSRKLTY